MSLNVELLEQSFEQIKPRADEFVATFYENLFIAHPEVQPLFAKTDMVHQRKKLLSSLVLVVENLRNPEGLAPVLTALGARHVGYGAISHYYPAVGEALLLTFKQYLQQDWTPEVKQAWIDAYGAITTLMLQGAGVDSPPQTIQLEEKIIEQKVAAPAAKLNSKLAKVSDSEPEELPVELLESSFEKIKPHADEFVATFYENLFIAHPEVQPLFAKTDMVNQRKKLLNALVLVVENLRNPEGLAPVLTALGARHVGYGAISHYYPAVGEALLKSFEQYLQQDWTPEVKQAWIDAYGAITTLMLQGAGVDSPPQTIQLEEKIIEQKVTAPAAKLNSKLAKVSDSEPEELPVELLESSFEKIKPRADEFVATFYENLFIAHPEVQPLFAKTDMVNQRKKLLNALVLVVENLRNPEGLAPVLTALGARHVGYGAIAKYYNSVGEALLLTFEQYLLQDWTPEVKQAWVAAYGAITALMLQGAHTQSSPQIAQNQPAVTLEKPSELKAEPKKQSKQILPQVSVEKWATSLKEIPGKISDTFWILPTWFVAIFTGILFIVVFVLADDNSLLAEVLESADALSLLIAVVLFIKEAPDRRKQFHYQAWSTIDAAHNVKVSYARLLALQDLNEDKVPLRGLDAPGAELVEINLFKADLSNANLNKADLSNANLSYANLDNAILTQAKLSGTNLSHAKLSFALLNKVNLSSANLSNASLICADLSRANLSGANLSNASLSGANFEGAYLTGANLKDAKVNITELTGAFLEGAIMPNGSKYQAAKS